MGSALINRNSKIFIQSVLSYGTDMLLEKRVRLGCLVTKAERQKNKAKTRVDVDFEGGKKLTRVAKGSADFIPV